jgi:hypothetical protein
MSDLTEGEVLDFVLEIQQCDAFEYEMSSIVTEYSAVAQII